MDLGRKTGVFALHDRSRYVSTLCTPQVWAVGNSGTENESISDCSSARWIGDAREVLNSYTVVRPPPLVAQPCAINPQVWAVGNSVQKLSPSAIAAARDGAAMLECSSYASFTTIIYPYKARATIWLARPPDHPRSSKRSSKFLAAQQVMQAPTSRPA